MNKIINRSILILFALIFTACGESPIGRKQVTLIPEGKLQAMGAQTFQELKRTKKIETNQMILWYVHYITERLVRNLRDNQVNWQTTPKYYATVIFYRGKRLSIYRSVTI